MTFPRPSLRSLSLGFALGLAAVVLPGLQEVHPGLRVLGLSPEQAEILDLLSVEHLDDGQGGLARTLRVTGANLQVVNGLGATNGHPADPGSTSPVLTATNSLGNLIVGYAELGGAQGDDRTGSHNLLLGLRNSASSFGALVGGTENLAGAPFASVVGGRRNSALGERSAVLGGFVNQAGGDDAAVAGGRLNRAMGDWSAVLGGHQNDANGSYAAVAGGLDNEANGLYSAVLGGDLNVAGGHYATVAGGILNTAASNFSTVSGGRSNTATGLESTVSGGYSRTAAGTYDWVAGGLFQSQ